MKKSIFSGVYAASLTPMHADLSCDHQELSSHIRDLLQRGCAGVVLFGTTGEGPSISVRERIETLNALIADGIDPQQLVITINFNTLDAAVEWANAALKLGCSKFLVLPPFFFKNITDEGVISFYRAFINKVANPEMKILLYHIPQLSGVRISLNTIKVLKEEFPKQVVGIKESEGNLAFTKEILSHFPDFNVLVGNELQIPEAIQLGAVGGISGIANIYPELICGLYENPSQEKVKIILDELKKHPLFPAIKALMAKKKGSKWEAIRPPLISLNPKIFTKFLT